VPSRVTSSLPKHYRLGAVGFHKTKTGDTALREDFEAVAVGKTLQYRAPRPSLNPPDHLK